VDDVGNGHIETGNSMADQYPGTRVRNLTRTRFQRHSKVRALVKSNTSR